MHDIAANRLLRFYGIRGIGLLFLLVPLILFSQSSLLNQPLNMPVQRGSVEYLLKRVSEQSGIPISYSLRFLKGSQNIEFEGSEKTVGDFLRRILEDQAVELVVRRGKIFLRPSKEKSNLRVLTHASSDRKVTLSGYIREKGSGERIIGAGVSLPSIRTGAYTNNFGFLQLNPSQRQI